MKTLKERVRKRVLARWLGYIAAAYLLASMGVNAAVNPLQDIKGMAAQAKELKIEECREGIVISGFDGSEEKGGAFLSFEIEEADNYSMELLLMAYPLEGKAQEAVVKAWKGWNSVDMRSFLQEGKAWKKIVVPQDEVESEGIALKGTVLSQHRKADVGRMLYVFASFLFLAAFWECVCWVKERYAD